AWVIFQECWRGPHAATGDRSRSATSVRPTHGQRLVHGESPLSLCARIGTMNPPLTPPRRGTETARTDACSPPGRGRGWVGSWRGREGAGCKRNRGGPFRDHWLL